MDELPNILGAPREWAKDMTTATAIGVFLGVIGPFGSFNGAALELRLFYWTVNMWIGFAILALVVRASQHAAVRLDLPVWFALGLGVAIGCLPLGFIIALFSAWVWPSAHGRVSGFLVWYGESLALAEPFSFAFYFLRRRDLRAAPAHAAADAPSGVETSLDPEPLPKPSARPPFGGGETFLERLPARLGRDLLCLQMEDHYVRAHTAKGSDLILIPLKQAVTELEDVEGMQVHRSWWVARAADPEPVTNGRNLCLRLKGGVEVPVSRASVAKLRAAGWLAAK